MNNIRVFFTKKDRAKYISHLDMYRLFMRCITRSELSVWYTEGFSPHMYMTFPLPLSLGYEGERECLDLKLTEEVPFDEVKEKLNGVFPLGVEVLEVAEPIMNQKEIAYADYDIKLYLTDDILETSKEKFEDFINQEKIIVVKKAKKSKKKVMKEIDIKPMCELLDCEMGEDFLNIKIRCVTGISENLNPSLLINAFVEKEQIRYISVKRIKTYNNSLQEFK